jgi:hypothetical protein
MGRSKGSITLSPKHGVNPSVLHCECCGKKYGIGLAGRLKDDAEAPKDVMYGFCDDCQKVIDQGGVMIVEVADGEGEKNPKNPYRTGRIVGCSKQYKERNKITTPMIYMEQSMFQAIFGEVEFK